MIDNPSIFREALDQKVAKIMECGQKFLSSMDRMKLLPLPSWKGRSFHSSKNKREKANNGEEKEVSEYYSSLESSKHDNTSNHIQSFCLYEHKVSLTLFNSKWLLSHSIF